MILEEEVCHHEHHKTQDSDHVERNAFGLSHSLDNDALVAVFSNSVLDYTSIV
jgi:hypothetical protein